MKVKITYELLADGAIMATGTTGNLVFVARDMTATKAKDRLLARFKAQLDLPPPEEVEI